MKENPKENTLKVVVEDEDNVWRISSGPTSVGYAKKILARQLEVEKKCTPEEIASILPKFEKELTTLITRYPEVEVEVLVDEKYILVKLRNLSRTQEFNVSVERSSLS